MEILNFDKYRPPILPVQMRDDQQTILNVTPPTFALQEELRAKAPGLNALLDSSEEEQRGAFWDLAARLMSCNRNHRHITAENLRTVYRLDEEDLVVFFNLYAEFLNNLEHAKN